MNGCNARIAAGPGASCGGVGPCCSASKADLGDSYRCCRKCVNGDRLLPIAPVAAGIECCGASGNLGGHDSCRSIDGEDPYVAAMPCASGRGACKCTRCSLTYK